MFIKNLILLDDYRHKPKRVPDRDLMIKAPQRKKFHISFSIFHVAYAYNFDAVGHE